jgi:hypothetical protein
VLAHLLHLRPLHLGDWAMAAAGGLLAGLLASGPVLGGRRRPSA